MRYIGIDPGASGGFAVLDDDGRAWACPMPKTYRGIRQVLDRLTESRTRRVEAVLENVWSSPGWGHAGAFSFGQNFGALQGMLECYDIEPTLVVPVKWQNVMQCRTPKARREELGHTDKNINKALAEQLFPGFEVTHAIADALLLAAYCRNLYGSQLPFLSAKEEPTHDQARRTKTRQARGQAKSREVVAEGSPA